MRPWRALLPRLFPAPGKGPDAGTWLRQLLASLLAMAWFVEARDPYTGGHLWRVSRYARLLGEAAGLEEAEAARISLGGFLHDLGKIGVADAILRKPGRLTAEEYAEIRTHPDLGLRLLAGHPLAHLVRDAVGLHHERPDGRGYPQGLNDGRLPLAARITAIADAFDAMTSHRPYRRGMPRNDALAIIAGEAGHQFDAALAGVFIGLGRAGALDHVLGHSDDGIPLRSCPMCGPTLVVQRAHRAGDRIYCRNCAGEFALLEQGGTLAALPTGRKGGPAELEPAVDTALIRSTIEAAVSALPVEELVASAGQR